MRIAKINAFTLGAIVYGFAVAAMIMAFYSDLIPNLSFLAYFLLIILIVFALATIFFCKYKRELLQKIFNVDIDNIDFTNLKDLGVIFGEFKARSTLLIFSFLLFTSIIGLLNIIFIQKQNQIMQSQLREQQALSYIQMKETVFSHLYDKEGGKAKYNSKIRENSLLNYLTIERIKKEENEKHFISREPVTNKAPNSLFQINLSKALLNNIEFTYQNMTKMNLNFVNFKNAVLQDTNFSKSHLSYADFENANLADANFSDTYLLYTNFYNAKMYNIRWNKKFEKIVMFCNIYNAKINEDLKKYLLSNGCVEEENLTKWKKNKALHFKKLGYSGK